MKEMNYQRMCSQVSRNRAISQVELQLRREVMGGSGTCSEAMSSAWARERSCFGCEMRGNFTASCAMLQEWGGGCSPTLLLWWLGAVIMTHDARRTHHDCTVFATCLRLLRLRLEYGFNVDKLFPCRRR